LFSSFSLSAQKKAFDHEFSREKKTIEEKDLIGYTTTFDFTRDEVRRGWWKYAKKFGNPMDMRAYYKVKVPDEMNDGNVDIFLFAESKTVDGSTHFFLGIKKESLGDNVLAISQNFKKQFYINHYLEEIAFKQKVAQGITDKKSEHPNDEALAKLNQLQDEIELLKTEILQIETY
jgi:hypothetical protein